MMGIFENIFGKKKKLPLSKVFRFERVESEFSIGIGDDVGVWHKPNSNQINLYANGSVAGRGLVGTTNNKVLAFHLSNPKYLFVENKIIDLTKNRIDLYIHMYRNKEAVIKAEETQKQKWLDMLMKKYKPTSSWELRFFADMPINISNIQVKTVEKQAVSEYYEKKEEAIWLIDDNKSRIKAENRIRQGGTEKTLRSVFSGHDIVVQSIKEEHPWYYLTVGIKNNAT